MTKSYKSKHNSYLRDGLILGIERWATGMSWINAVGYIENLDPLNNRDTAEWGRRSDAGRAIWLTGKLWNSTDQLGSDIASTLNDRPGAERCRQIHTVGNAARFIRAEIRKEQNQPQQRWLSQRCIVEEEPTTNFSVEVPSKQFMEVQLHLICRGCKATVRSGDEESGLITLDLETPYDSRDQLQMYFDSLVVA